jgi:hypothetical protein
MKRIKNKIRFTMVDWERCPALIRIETEADTANYTPRCESSDVEDIVCVDRYLRDRYAAKLLFTRTGLVSGIHFKTTRDAIAFQLSTV